MHHILPLTVLFCQTQHFPPRADEGRGSRASVPCTAWKQHTCTPYLPGRRAAARLPGTAGRTRAGAPGCWSAGRPRWSCAGPPRTSSSSAARHTSSPSSKETTGSSVQNGISVSVKKTAPHTKPQGRRQSPAQQRGGAGGSPPQASTGAITGSYISHSFL